MFQTELANTTLCIIALALVIRAALSVNAYSGAQQPPMHGDLEAQRHWMEITVNTPIQQWYRNSTDNDLLYWGLDYPPLTAYFSWAFGLLAELIVPDMVQLHTSRGIETPEAITFMRWSVIATDILIYVPAALYCVEVFMKLRHPEDGSAYTRDYVATLMSLLFAPALLLVDHAHFQYNNASLGLMLASVACLFDGKHGLCAVAFSLALNYKHMELYHALPIFLALLHRCIHAPHDVLPVRLQLHVRVLDVFGSLCYLGVIVIATFAVLWLPFCWGPLPCSLALKSVISRLFPFDRSLFEDKVANWWCVLEPITKFRAKIYAEKESLTTTYDSTMHMPAPVRGMVVAVCLVSTLFALLPVGVLLYRKLLSAGKHTFSYFSAVITSLAASSLAFFLFAYQVHEKNILLATVPVALLLTLSPLLSVFISLASVSTMWPLLAEKDELSLPFYVMCLAYALVTMKMMWDALLRSHAALWLAKRLHVSVATIVTLCYALALSPCLLHAMSVFIPPPASLPDLYPYFTACVGAVLFTGAYGMLLLELTNVKQHVD